MRGIIAVLKNTFAGYSDHKVARMGAALSYFTAFSIGPILLISIAVAGVVFGHDAANTKIFEQLKGLVGNEAASAVQESVKASAKASASVLATIIGAITLLVGAAGVFQELHDGLNTVWGVRAKPNGGVWSFLRERFLSLTMVLGTGFLLLVSLILTTVLAIVGKWLSSSLPGGEVLWHVLNFIISLGVIAVLFTLILKFVPDVKLPWRDAFIAGGVTAVLFTIGKLAIGIYIGKAGVASAFGAAGSFIVLLVWVFYSSQILYLGAELSRALAQAWHENVKPTRNAARVMADRASSGIQPAH